MLERDPLMAGWGSNDLILDAVKALVALIDLNPDDDEELDIRRKVSALNAMAEALEADTLVALANAIVREFSGDDRPATVIVLGALLLHSKLIPIQRRLTRSRAGADNATEIS